MYYAFPYPYLFFDDFQQLEEQGMQPSNSKNISLQGDELLLRHQLNVAYYWQSRSDVSLDITPDATESAPSKQSQNKWNLLNGLELHDWQVECMRNWFAASKRGVVKVVTGAGKTVLALAIAQELQNNHEPDLRVAIIVPTIVLMGQWYDAIARYGNLPPEAVGRLGGGFSDDFSGKKRILIAVLASASKLLAARTKGAIIAESLLLVVDECHRAGAEKMSNVFQARRAYSLGLSATPERDDAPDPGEEQEADLDAEENFEDTIIGQQLGPIVYELTFAQAIERGILPRFEICHFGLPLGSDERTAYEKHSREITELRNALQQSSKAASSMDGGMLVGWARKIAARPNTRMAESAAEYVRQISLRKQLLYRAHSRECAVIQLLRREFSENPETRAILFHESVSEVMRLFQLLRAEGFAVVPENYRLTETLRSESIDLFRRGIAQVLVSARSLIEGFDVPAADVGIVIASTSSVRQRIQTLGRILRKHKDHLGEQKHAVLHVLYAAKTVDEMIYEKNDWATVIGAERNLYFLWDPEVDETPIPQQGPPRRLLPLETAIDWQAIQPGDIYPGRYEGDEYSSDSRGNIFDAERRVAANPQGIEELLSIVKGSYGRFRVTPRKRAILVRVLEDGNWVTRIAGFLKEPFQFRDAEEEKGAAPIDIATLEPGDDYPRRVGTGEEYRLKRRARDAIVARRVKGGEVFARIGGQASDPDKGLDAERVVAAARKAAAREGNWIPKFQVNDSNHAVYLSQGKTRFLCALKKGFEFPGSS